MPKLDGIAARARGKRQGRPVLDQAKLASALHLIEIGLSPARAAKQLGLGQPTLCRELAAPGASIPMTSSLPLADIDCDK